MSSAYLKNPGGSFSVLMVCTGNVVRSPLAEQLFAARLARSLEPRDAALVTTASAGVRALVGQDLTPETRRLARAAGLTPQPHTARQLERPLVDDADLVLGANRAHRRFIVELAPAAASKCFTLREFAQVMRWFSTEGGVVPVRQQGQELPAALTAVVRAASRQRGLAPRVANPGAFDIRDPYGRPRFVYAEVGRLISAAVDTVVSDLLRLSGATERLPVGLP